MPGTGDGPKIQMEPETGVTFADVAGCDGSKLELMEVVEFLKSPGKFAALGAKIPKGAVMEGPPGTGKTLLARAVAGEAGVPFISASGSEFVEMYVGLGAKRVRDLFDQAKKNAPCIVFIDEIDAVGKQRGGGGGQPTNDEREQTLNQILTEMDGFDGDSGVVVLAATNLASSLDNALTRPGRFDRRIPVDLPDKDGRLQILHVHARDKPLAADLDMEAVAKRTVGFSGASLANLLNEAAIVAARRDKTEIGWKEVDYSLDRLTVGMEQKTGTSSRMRQRLVGVHEAGHAICGLLAPGYDKVSKVTLIPRSNGAGGFTLFEPTEERMSSGLYTKRYLEDQLVVALGGRAAEEVVFGESEVTTGASSDLQQVRNIARGMVSQLGMAGDLGQVAWEGDNMPSASDATLQRIDEEVSALVEKAYERAKRELTENMDAMNELVDLLIEKETVDYWEMSGLIAKHRDQKVADAIV